MKFKYDLAYLFVLAGLASGLYVVEANAQAAKPAEPSPAAKTEPATTGTLTELEQDKLLIIQLRAQLASTQQQLAQIQLQLAQQDYGPAVQSIQAAHPGFVWNPQQAALVPLPAPPPAPKQDAPAKPAAK